MRIIAGAWRGRRLVAPEGQATRPTADRVRQALFDMLIHAPWGGRGAVAGARVLDVFAGTGALGLEALSRGAAKASFIERDPAALRALRANIASCRAGDRATVLAVDVRDVPAGEACGLVFLDPPYEAGLIPDALRRLMERGWVASGALVVAETPSDTVRGRSGCSGSPRRFAARDDAGLELLAERDHGPARITVWRAGA